MSILEDVPCRCERDGTVRSRRRYLYFLVRIDVIKRRRQPVDFFECPCGISVAHKLFYRMHPRTDIKYVDGLDKAQIRQIIQCVWRGNLYAKIFTAAPHTYIASAKLQQIGERGCEAEFIKPYFPVSLRHPTVEQARTLSYRTIWPDVCVFCLQQGQLILFYVDAACHVRRDFAARECGLDRIVLRWLHFYHLLKPCAHIAVRIARTALCFYDTFPLGLRYRHLRELQVRLHEVCVPCKRHGDIACQ